MNCIKNISITGYQVKFVDLREPKPRTPHEEIYTVDKDWIEAMNLLRLDVHDAIKARYERAGYHVFSVVQLKPKLCVSVDLNQLYLEQYDAEAALTEDRAQEVC